MAGTTISRVTTGMPGSDVEALRLEFNKLVDDVELLRAQLALTQTKVNNVIVDAATSLAAIAAEPALTTTAVDTAGDLLAAKIANQNGSTTV
jgi:hypothetical protein